MTRVKVAKWGNSLGLRLPRALVREVGLEEGQIVELTARDGGIDVKPTNKVPRYQLAELLAEAERLGPENRPPSEDWGILPSEWPNEDWSDIAPTDEEMGIEDAADRRSPRQRR
jgi:antitoxin MazE